MNQKISNNFYGHEFLHPQIFEMMGNNAMRYIDEKLIIIAEALRQRFDHPLTINNYAWGGRFSMSGLRPFNTMVGAKYSDHKFGRAIDIKMREIHPDEVRVEIQKNYDKWRELGITAIETGTPSWTHISTANFQSKALKLIPNK